MLTCASSVGATKQKPFNSNMQNSINTNSLNERRCHFIPIYIAAGVNSLRVSTNFRHNVVKIIKFLPVVLGEEDL